MKRINILLFILLMMSMPSMATKRALVIGIGAYPAAGGWKAINGDKDVPVVKSMLQANGFAAKDITTLLNEQATCKRITTEFQRLIAASAQGDFVYIHFSGHGQQITDVHGDEEDGLDEAWIPYDAQLTYQKGKYEGQNHLLDDQLNKFLTELRKKVGKQGKIIVVADACHSGGSTRAVEEDTTWVARGSMDTFIIPGTPKAYNPNNQSRIDWVQISACKSHQTNFEYKGTGSLTYALSQLKGELSTLTCQQLLKKIGSTIRSIIPYTQSPQLDCADEMKETKFF